MLTTVATVLAALIGAGIIVIGARVFWRRRPQSGSASPARRPTTGRFRPG